MAEVTTQVQKNISACHRSSCGLSQGKKRCSCEPTYRVRVSTGVRGKQKWITRRFATQPEAQRWLLEQQTSPAATGDHTLASLLDAFAERLDSGKARDKNGRVYKPSTAQDYAASIDLLQRDYREILRKPLDLLVRSDLQLIVDSLAESRGPQRVRNVMNPIRVVLGEAARDDLVRTNPMNEIRWPAKRSVEPRVVDFDEDSAMVDRLEPPLQVLYGLALYAGLRRGEAMGLRWGRVDFEERAISVAESFTHDAFTDPKSAAGRRQVPIASRLFTILREWHSTCVDRGEDFVADDALVLAGPSPQRPISRSRLDRLAAKQNAPSRIHELRHSHGTMLARSGVDLKDAQLILGHSDALTTMSIYQHASVGMLARVRERLDDGFGADERLPHAVAEAEAWEEWAKQLEDENRYLITMAEAQGGSYELRDSPLWDM